MTRLSSDRLYFRKLTALDATPEYAAWLNDPEVNRYLEVRHHAHSVDGCKEFIEHSNADPGSHLFGMFLRGSDEHIGNIKIGFVDERYRSGQISFLIGAKNAWGKGFATEAVKCLTKHAFSDLNLFRVEAGVYEENLGSLRALMRSGYTVEGFFKKKYLTPEGLRSGCFWLAALQDEWRLDEL